MFRLIAECDYNNISGNVDGKYISDIDVNVKQNIWSIEIEYVEKGIVVEDLDGWVTGPRVS